MVNCSCVFDIDLIILNKSAVNLKKIKYIIIAKSKYYKLQNVTVYFFIKRVVCLNKINIFAIQNEM